MPRNVRQLIQNRFGLARMRQMYPGMPVNFYRELVNQAVDSVAQRAELLNRARGRPQTAFDRHADELAFATVDDAAFLEATQHRVVPRVTRHARANLRRQIVAEQAVQVPRQSRYNHSFMYTLRMNNYDLRTNLMAIFDQMSVHVAPGHEYRIRMVWRHIENMVRRPDLISRRQTGVYRTVADWFNGFESFYDAYSNMFQSNELINIFDTEFYLDVFNQVAAGGAENDWPQIKYDGLYMTPKRSNNLCGWMALTIACLDNGVGPKFKKYNSYRGITENKETGKSAQQKWMVNAEELRLLVGGSKPMNVVDDINKFVAAFPKLKVVVFKAPHCSPHMIVKGNQIYTQISKK